jgi:acyl-CoA synthetase (AMP-forming)/AMP-acid ligase II
VNCLARAGLLVDNSITLGDVVPRLAALRGDQRLVEEGGRRPPLRLTYGEAARRLERMAGSVAASIRPRDRVVVALPNGYDLFLASLAVCRAGGVAVPVNPLMRGAEVDHVIADSSAALVVRDVGELLGGEPLDEGAIAARRGNPDEVAAIFYTSGTTGKPKGAELSHRALAGSVLVATLWPSGLRRDEIVAGLPVAHIMGFAVTLAAAATGIPLYLFERFRAPAVLDAIEQRRATIFIGVPAMYRMLLEAGAERRDLTSVRLWASGADVMPPELARRFQRMGAAVTVPLMGRALGDAMFVEGYGMVETGGAVAMRVSPPGVAVDLPLLGRTLGIPLPGYHLRVVDVEGAEVGPGQVGELVVRGPGVLRGYHGDRQATARVLDEEGWLHTGDLVRRGFGGLVSFVGRTKDVIKTGGYSVYAVEVEHALEQHPDVIEAAALGVPDERLGEQTVVAVQLRDGATVDEQELLDWAGAKLSSYKRPRMVRIVEELPRTGTQKVAKRELLPLFAA